MLTPSPRPLGPTDERPGSRGPLRRRGLRRRPDLERLEPLRLLSASPPVVNLGASASPGGASLVADLIPGTTGSSPNSFVDAGGLLVFQALDPTSFVNKLWVSDGTAGGTREIDPNLEPAQFVAPAAAGPGVVFTAFDLTTHQFGIYASDGTTAGTQLLAPLPSSSTNAQVAVGSTVYFDISDFSKSSFNPPEELWKSDGTPGGTGFVADIPQGPTGFTASGGKLYFTADDGVHGTELWVSDGTQGGTGMVADLAPGSAASYPNGLTDVNGTLAFIAQGGSAPNAQLWVTDGTAAGTVVVAPALQPFEVADFGGKVLFGAVDPTGDAGLYLADPSTGATQQVAALPAGSSLAVGAPLTVVGGRAFFGLYDASGQFQLWATDATAGGTAKVADLVDASSLTSSGGRLYFASDDANWDTHLWSSDGTPSGTAMVPAAIGGPIDVSPNNLTNLGGTLYFDATDPAHGDELWSAVPPTQSSLTPIDEGSTFTLSGSFADQAGDGPWSATVDYGDGSGIQPLALNPDHTFTLSHAYGDEGSYTVVVHVAGAGGDGSATVTAAVLAVPPAAAITGAPSTSPEGTTIVLDSKVSSPSPDDTAAGFAESWVVRKDGAFYSAGSGTSYAFTPDDDGVYTVTLTATDDGNNTSAPAVVTIDVTRVAPTAAIQGAPPSGPEGTPIALTGSAVDPSAVDTAAGFTYTWTVTRDGNPVASGTGAGFAFTPPDDGTYTVTLVAADEDGEASAPVSQAITVTHVPPTVTIAGAPGSTTEGTPIALTGGVTVVNPADLDGLSYAWVVTKDGQAFASGTGAGFTFTPDDEGTYVASLTVTDQDGGTGTASVAVPVAPLPPTVTVRGDTSGVRGQNRHLVISASDLSSEDNAAGFAFVVDWGDGSPAQQFRSAAPVSLGHVYQATGTYSVQVRATDEDGLTAANTQSIQIDALEMQADPNDPTRTALVVGGTQGSDMLLFRAGATLGSVRVRLNGLDLGSYTPTGRIVAFGQSGNDTIVVSQDVKQTAELHAGSGADTLLGGGGDNILVGGSGTDLLVAGRGRNILIGGSGAGLILGLGGDDLMVGGSTAYDNDSAALGAILAEWDRGIPVAQRAQDLSTGIAWNGTTIKLDATTVATDRAIEILVLGAGDTDWVIVPTKQQVLGADADDVVTVLN